jgi:hypothetical protein
MPSVEVSFGHQELQGNLGGGMRADDKIGACGNQLPGSGNARQGDPGDCDGRVRGINKANFQSDSNLRAKVGILCDFVTANDERGCRGDSGAEELYRQQEGNRY